MDNESSNTTGETTGQQGAALMAEVLAKGVSVDYGLMTSAQKISYWNSQASRYATAEAFLSGIGLEEGGTVTVLYYTIGDLVISDTGEVIYDGSEEFFFGDTGLSVEVVTTPKYGTAWGMTCLLGVEVLFIISMSDSTGELLKDSIGVNCVNDTFFNLRVPDDDYYDESTKYWFSTKSGYLFFHYNVSCQRRYSKHLGNGVEGYDMVYRPGKDEYANIKLSIKDLITTESFITFSMGSGGDDPGGGGSGGGGDGWDDDVDWSDETEQEPDLKPVYRMQSGSWVKQTAYQMTDGNWVKISSAENGGSYTRLSVSGELYLRSDTVGLSLDAEGSLISSGDMDLAINEKGELVRNG